MRKFLFAVQILLFFILCSTFKAQGYDPPTAYTDNFQFRMWTQGAKPGADGLNSNWIDIDAAIFTTRTDLQAQIDSIRGHSQHLVDSLGMLIYLSLDSLENRIYTSMDSLGNIVYTSIDSLGNKVYEIVDSALVAPKGYYSFIVNDEVVNTASPGNVRFYYRSAYAAEDTSVLLLSGFYAYADLSKSKHTVNQGTSTISDINNSPYLAPKAFSGEFTVNQSSDFTFNTEDYTIDFWFYLADGDSAQMIRFNTATFEISTNYEPTEIYFRALGSVATIPGFLYDQWNHVEYSYDSVKDSVFAYLNGELKSTTYFPVANYGTAVEPLILNYSATGSLLMDNIRFIKGKCLHRGDVIFYPQLDAYNVINPAGMYVVTSEGNYSRLAFDNEIGTGGGTTIINSDRNIIIEGQAGHYFDLSKNFVIVSSNKDGTPQSGEIGSVNAKASTLMSVYRGTQKLQVVENIADLVPDKYYIKDVYVPGVSSSERIVDGNFETANVADWLLRYCDIVPGNTCPDVYMRMIATNDPNWVISGNYSARITNGGRGYTVWKDNLNLEIGNTYRLRMRVKVRNDQINQSYIKFFRNPSEDDYTQITGAPTYTISNIKGEYLIDESFSTLETGGYFAIQTGGTYFDGVNPPTFYFSDISIDEVSITDSEGTVVFTTATDVVNNEAHLFVEAMGKEIWDSYAMVTLQMHDSNPLNALYMTRFFNVKKLINFDQADTTFIQHKDTPNSYVGSANYRVVVNSTATGLRFEAIDVSKSYVDQQDGTKADTGYVNTQLNLKADKSTMAEFLALKANQTEVDSALNTKADSSYVNEQLALKSDSSWVQTQLDLKADSSAVNEKNILQDNEINTKADSSWVQAQLDLKADSSAVNEKNILQDNEINTKADSSWVQAQLDLKADSSAVNEKNLLQDNEINTKADSSWVVEMLSDKPDTNYVNTKIGIALGATADTNYVNNKVGPKADTSYVNEKNLLQDNEINTKADSSWVQAQLDLKADSSAVNEKNILQDNEINTKADSSWVQAQLDLKADSSAVNEKFNNLEIGDLADVPNYGIEDAGKVLAINGSGDAVEYIADPTALSITAYENLNAHQPVRIVNDGGVAKARSLYEVLPSPQITTPSFLLPYTDVIYNTRNEVLIRDNYGRKILVTYHRNSTTGERYFKLYAKDVASYEIINDSVAIVGGDNFVSLSTNIGYTAILSDTTFLYGEKDGTGLAGNVFWKYKVEGNTLVECWRDTLYTGGSFTGDPLKYGLQVLDTDSTESKWIRGTYATTSGSTQSYQVYAIYLNDGNLINKGSAPISVNGGGYYTGYGVYQEVSSITYKNGRMFFMFAYGTAPNQYIFKAHLLSVNFTSGGIGFASSPSLSINTDIQSIAPRVAKFSDNFILCAYTKDATGLQENTIVEIVNDNSISVKVRLTISGETDVSTWYVEHPDPQKLIVATLNDATNEAYTCIYNLSAPGTSITVSDKLILDSVTGLSPTALAVGKNYREYVFIHYASTIGYREFIGFESYTANEEYYIGITQSSVTAGSSVILKLIGGISTGWTGLSIGNYYYLYDDGSLYLGKTAYRVGMAVGSTKLLLVK